MTKSLKLGPTYDMFIMSHSLAPTVRRMKFRSRSPACLRIQNLISQLHFGALSLYFHPGFVRPQSPEHPKPHANSRLPQPPPSSYHDHAHRRGPCLLAGAGNRSNRVACLGTSEKAADLTTVNRRHDASHEVQSGSGTVNAAGQLVYCCSDTWKHMAQRSPARGDFDSYNDS